MRMSKAFATSRERYALQPIRSVLSGVAKFSVVHCPWFGSEPNTFKHLRKTFA